MVTVYDPSGTPPKEYVPAAVVVDMLPLERPTVTPPTPAFPTVTVPLIVPVMVGSMGPLGHTGPLTQSAPEQPVMTSAMVRTLGRFRAVVVPTRVASVQTAVEIRAHRPFRTQLRWLVLTGNARVAGVPYLFRTVDWSRWTCRCPWPSLVFHVPPFDNTRGPTARLKTVSARNPACAGSLVAVRVWTLAGPISMRREPQ